MNDGNNCPGIKESQYVHAEIEVKLSKAIHSPLKGPGLKQRGNDKENL